MPYRPSPKKRSGKHSQLAARIDGLFEKGIAAHRAGDRNGAREIYRRILGADPRHADACHLLGFAEFQDARFAEAVVHLSRAVRLAPRNAEFHNNLALALLASEQLPAASNHAQRAFELGCRDGHGYLHVGWEFFVRRRFDMSEHAYRLALYIQSDSAEPHNYLGVLFAEQQRWDEAIACYRQALDLRPNYLEALNNWGNALRDQGRVEEAIPIYHEALRRDSQFVLAHNNLGVALLQHGQAAAAVECFQRALNRQPDFVEALNNLGSATFELGRGEEALCHYAKAFQLRPNSAEILSNVGARLCQLGRYAEAISLLRRAVILQPHSVPIHCHLASALVDEGRIDAAAACCRHVVVLDRRQPLWSLRAATLCPTVFSSRDGMEDYQRNLNQAIVEAQQAAFDVDLRTIAEVAPPFPFAMQFVDGELRSFKQSFAQIFHERLAKRHHAPWIESWRGPRLRPRLGFVVTEGHEGIFLKTVRAIIERWPRNWDLFVFCSLRGQEHVRTEILRDDLRVVAMPKRCDHMATIISQAQCDLLYHYEVGTDATNYFLAFLRLAPLQVTSWGVQLTSGIPNIDAYVSSALMEPAGAQQSYTERLCLINTMLSFRRRTLLPPQTYSRDQFVLPPDAHWYVCAQQPGKIHIDCDELFRGILVRDPQGIVILTGDRFGHHAEQLRQRFARRIPAEASRIHVVPRLDPAHYLSLLQEADVLLDGPHFAGGNSTYDGLSLGKPIVAFPSPFQRGRYTLGCYRQMGVTDCVVASADAYVELAVRLATDREFHQEISSRIGTASDAIFDDATVIDEHERIFSALLHWKACQ